VGILPKTFGAFSMGWQAIPPKVPLKNGLLASPNWLHGVLKGMWLFSVHSPIRRKRPMKLTYVLATALILGTAGAAVAAQNQFFIVQDKDKNCRIIESKPDVADKQVVQLGKEVYQTREEAEVDIKVVGVTP
jgi:glucose dehydrogenase